jgi:hypothetical protein
MYEEQAVRRRLPVDFGLGPPLYLITPEDLIVMKAFAGRNQDWADIEGVFARQGSLLDWDYILPHVRGLAEAKEDPEMEPKLLAIKAEEEAY